MSPSPDLSRVSDQDLVALALEGREEGFDGLVRRYQDPVFLLLRHLVREDDLAEDLLQETFIRVWQKLDTYRPDQSFEAWIFAIANNIGVDYLRKKQPQTVPLEDEPFVTPSGKIRVGELQAVVSPFTLSAPRRVDPGLFRVAFEQALGRLSAQDRRCFTLRAIDELSFEHIAEIVDLPTGTVKTCVRRARDALRDMLGPLLEITPTK